MAMLSKQQLMRTQQASTRPHVCRTLVPHAISRRFQAISASATKSDHASIKEGPSACYPAMAMAAAAVLVLSNPGSSFAMGTKVGEFQASGFLFKDSVELAALDDPEVLGVTVYVADFKRSIVDKLAKDFFSEPSQASISCAITGPVSFRQGTPEKLSGGEGQEMFSESKGFNLFKNKTLRIRRSYDAARNTLLYTAYSTRLSSAADDGNVSSGRYRTSLCAVKLPDSVLEAPSPSDN